jgi:hypothetical protein
LKPEPSLPAEDVSIEGVSLVSLYKAVLRIVEHLDEGVAPSAKAEYSDDQLRQTTEVELDDLANPASAVDTSQG